jgi:hypothetical protein
LPAPYYGEDGPPRAIAVARPSALLAKRKVFRKPFLFWFHSSCALVILAAGAWAFAGAGIGELTPLYIGEVAAVMAFGASWLIAGISKTAPARVRPAPVTAHGPALPVGADREPAGR